jgi:hypothetical protein
MGEVVGKQSKLPLGESIVEVTIYRGHHYYIDRGHHIEVTNIVYRGH